jgi:hypothetical protein
MKQTAVDWLIQQIIKEKGLVDLDIQAAKEMEKEQIIEAHLNGQSEWDIKALEDINIKLCNQYYNETYGDDT